MEKPATSAAAKEVARVSGNGRLDKQLDHLIRTVFAPTFEYQHAGRKIHESKTLTDYLFATTGDSTAPDEVFSALRWGGQFVFLSRNRKEVEETARRFRQTPAFIIEIPPMRVKRKLMGFVPAGTRYFYFSARKVMLIKPGESSDRFTYHVQLVRARDIGMPGDGYVVMKQVPTLDRVVSRLKEKFPDADMDTIRRRAKKFTEKIFPVFLTREAAILKLLQRDLPKNFADRVPHVIRADQDQSGFVRTLYMNWLRNAVPPQGPLTQLQFARQATELLVSLHDVAHIIHLDLRLDNFVITERGVGFVDFGSAVRVGEHFAESSLLGNLFEEMMRTSQIQRMLGTMQEKGLVTSQEIRNSYQRIDKAVDFFYLAVQINAPHTNPDFQGLVKVDAASAEAAALHSLTEQILRPSDPEHPAFRSAKDILAGIGDVERQLSK
jgi:tRNA A-37 threonylcarbamoyl transferase component Bud32